MKKYFEIFLVIFVLFIIIYSLFYSFYFNSICEKYSGVNEQDYTLAIIKLAKCKDSLICYNSDIKSNITNEVTDWKCNKTDIPLLGKDLYIKKFNNLKNIILK